MMDFETDFESLFVPPAVVAAKEAIQLAKLDYMRCALSGAPYARVTDSELTSTLVGFCGGEYLGEEKAESLIDQWDLALLTMCSRVSPALVNRKEHTLRQFVGAGEHGAARLATFYMVRFLFSSNGYTSSEAMINRLHFSINWFDFLSLPENEESTRKLAFNLATTDSWLNLSLWKELPLFGNRARTHGIKSPRYHDLRQALVSPVDMPVNNVITESLTDAMMELLVASELNGMGPAPIANSNQESILVARELMNVYGQSYQAKAAEKREVVLTLSQVLAQIEDEKRHRATATRQPVSATYGNGYRPGEKPDFKLMSALKAAKESKEAKAKAAKEAKEAKAKLPKEAKAGLSRKDKVKNLRKYFTAAIEIDL